jgi:hypothetical protein
VSVASPLRLPRANPDELKTIGLQVRRQQSALLRRLAALRESSEVVRSSLSVTQQVSRQLRVENRQLRDAAQVQLAAPPHAPDDNCITCIWSTTVDARPPLISQS